MPDEHVELKERVAAEWLDFMNKIQADGESVFERVQQEGLLLDLDDEQDRLRILIGGVPTAAYSQGRDHVYLDLDIDTDEILGVTIRDFSTYKGEIPLPRTIVELLPALHHIGQLRIPPMSRGSREVAQEKRDLVPA
jgi:hypothetical protein